MMKKQKVSMWGQPPSAVERSERSLVSTDSWLCVLDNSRYVLSRVSA